MRYTCERCKKTFSSWLFESGDYVTNICVSCYYKAVNQREMEIQEIVGDVLDEHGIQAAIGVYNKLTYPDKKEKKKKENNK